MYRNFVRNALDINEFNKRIKTAPEGMSFCNAFCQSYLSKDNFYDTVSKACCKVCHQHVEKARKLMDTNKISIEQFLDNPDIIKREKTIIPIFRKCVTCEEDKTLKILNKHAKNVSHVGA